VREKQNSRGRERKRRENLEKWRKIVVTKERENNF